MIARSLLFVPGNRPERFDKALGSGADAIILDLEDAVPAAQRETAGREVIRWITARQPAPPAVEIWVRIPAPDDRSAMTQALSALPALAGLVLPKLEHPDQLESLDVPCMGLIETARGLHRLDALCEVDARLLVGLILGPEDLSVSLGCSNDRVGLSYGCERIVLAARATGRRVYAIPGTIAEFADLQAWRESLETGQRIGSDGALCIHPAQVGVANQVFSPSDSALAQARRIIAAFDESLVRGQGAVQLDGKMIDLPVVERARQVLSRAGTIVGAVGSALPDEGVRRG